MSLVRVLTCVDGRWVPSGVVHNLHELRAVVGDARPIDPDRIRFIDVRGLPVAADSIEDYLCNPLYTR